MADRPPTPRKRPAEQSPEYTGMGRKRPDSAPGKVGMGADDDGDVHISDDDGESDDDGGMAAPPFAFSASPGVPRPRPETAPTKRKTVALGTDDEQVKKSLRRSFNICPICKMPLSIDAIHVPDQKWNTVQSWFKSKPASIIQDGKGRPINAFGLAPGVITKHSVGYNKCHFLHNVASSNSPSFNGVWQHGVAVLGDGTKELKPIKEFVGESPKTDEFLKCLDVNNSIFKLVVHNPGGAPKKISDGFLFNPLNMDTLNKVTDRISSHTIAACWDCNSKMTQTDYIKPIFSAFFSMPIPFPELGQRHAQRTNVELHYILLQILLSTASVFDDNAAPRMDSGLQAFQMDRDMSSTWRLNLGITWCMLMIMSSQWNIKKLDNMTKHHEIYMLHGTSDFYLSLLLYIVFAANYPQGRDDMMHFEEFHFFYITNFVFYLKKRGVLAAFASDNNNLSASILHRGAMSPPIIAAVQWKEIKSMDWPEFSETLALRNVPLTVQLFHTKVTQFIKEYFQPLCQQLYAWTPGNDPAQITSFFPSPDRVKALTASANQQTDLSIHNFITVLGASDRYWFPFKHITMVQIANALGDAYAFTHPNFKPMFSLWYHHAATSALLLSRAPSLVESHRAEQDEDDDDVGLLLSRRLTLN